MEQHAIVRFLILKTFSARAITAELEGCTDISFGGEKVVQAIRPDENHPGRRPKVGKNASKRFL
jgi:hypothetical protein